MSTKARWMLLVAAIGGAGGNVSAQEGANLVENGDFSVFVPSNGTGGGWTTSHINHAGGWRSSGGNPGGMFILNDVGVGSDPTITQNVTGLVAGAVYQVIGDYTSWHRNDLPRVDDDSFEVLVDGVVLFQASPTSPTQAWLDDFSFTFVATSDTASITLRAEANGSDNDFAIDNIAIEQLGSTFTLSGVVFSPGQGAIPNALVRVGGVEDVSAADGSYSLTGVLTEAVVLVEVIIDGRTDALRLVELVEGLNEFDLQVFVEALDEINFCSADFVCPIAFASVVPIIGTPADIASIGLGVCSAAQRFEAGQTFDAIIVGGLTILETAWTVLGLATAVTGGGLAVDVVVDLALAAIICAEARLHEAITNHCSGFLALSCIRENIGVISRDLGREFIFIFVASPADIRITDADGNALGVDANGEVFSELASPSWIFRSPSHQQLAVVFDPLGTYSVEIVGRPEAGSGATFDLQLLRQHEDGSQELVTYVDVPTSESGVAVTEIAETIAPTLLVDADGDGAFEAELEPNTLAQTTIMIQPDAASNNDASVDSQGGHSDIFAFFGSCFSINFRSYQQYDLSSIPSGATINSATYNVDIFAWCTSSHQMAAYRVLAPWNEATIRWTNQPAHDGSTPYGARIAGTPTTTPPGYNAWDITALVQFWVDNPGSNNGFVLRSVNENVFTAAILGYNAEIAAEFGGQSPFLQITYEEEDDGDGDGVPDGEDACPDSNLSATVVIDLYDSGVENALFNDGCTMSDLIQDCADGANNHGQFVSCVAHLTNEWNQQGLITGQEKGAIQSCAAQANIP